MEENNISFEKRLDLSDLQQSVQKIRDEISKVIIGQDKMLDLLLTSILTNGHVLIEGVPGVAKTLVAKAIAKTISVDFSRIQFTPDLMPSDILGTSVFNLKTSEFQFNKGPIFSNIVLIDEINRSPAKTQAALFEVMEERQISIDSYKFIMDEPFLVVATQNPIEQEGTYNLPEAQLDRFLFRIQVPYPTLDQETEILARHHENGNLKDLTQINPVISGQEIVKFQKLVEQVNIEEKLRRYIAEIINLTRIHPHIYLGGSPRASINIMNAAKSFAAIQGRDFVIPDDIQAVIDPVLNHRIIISPERELEGIKTSEVIRYVIDSIEVPR